MHGILSRIPVSKQNLVARSLLVAAGVLLAYGVLLPAVQFTTTAESSSSGALWWRETTERSVPLDERLPYLFIAIAGFAVVALLVATAVRLFTMQSSLRKYPPILVGVESMRIQQIADIANTSMTRVYRDIQAMIDSGMISDFYIDYKAEQVVSKKYIPERSHKTVVTCSGCGGNSEVIVGIPRDCSFCGQPLVLNPA